MGCRTTAVAWLERHYDDWFADGEGVVCPAGPMAQLRVTDYYPDRGAERESAGPLFSIKRDALCPEPEWPEAASWPEPHPEDHLDAQENW